LKKARADMNGGMFTELDPGNGEYDPTKQVKRNET
jgi:hypothetical protein